MFYSLMFLEHSKEQKAALGCCGSVRPSLGGQLSEAVQAGVGVGSESTRGQGDGALRCTSAAGN